ncbi:DNA polymerase I, thermostable [compost metagenome]
MALTTAKGLPVDAEFAAGASRKLADELVDIEGRLRRDPDVAAYSRKHGALVPTEPDQVLRFLKHLGRPEVEVVDKKTKAVKFSTDEEVLNAIGAAVPACALILEHRGVAKLKGTYVDPTASGANVCPDGFIRSNYNSMHTVTDRLSSDDPAVQNWPKRKHKWVRAMISAAIKRHGMREVLRWFVALDYGQIEFRVVGMASDDPNLVKYCWTGYDVHKAWAQRLLKVYPEVQDWILREFDEALGKQRVKDGKEFDEDKAILKTLRQEMKNKWVFPQLFGSSTRSCAQSLHLPDHVADDLGGEFWDEFRDVKKWQERVLRGYAKNNYVETLTGVRRRGPTTPNEAINMPIQGTAAAIVKAAMNALSIEAELRDDPELQPSLNVHDDLSTIIADENLESKLPTIARIMCEHRFDFINVPLVVEASVGPNWADLEEVAVYRSDVLFNLKNPYS